MEVGLDQRGVDHGAAGVGDPELIRRVAGVREDHLIALVDDREQGLGEGVLGAHRDQHLLAHRRPAALGGLLGDRVAQLGQARARDVAHVPVGDRLGTRLHDVGGGTKLLALEVALLEVDHALAGVALQRLRLAHRRPLLGQDEMGGAARDAGRDVRLDERAHVVSSGLIRQVSPDSQQSSRALRPDRALPSANPRMPAARYPRDLSPWGAPVSEGRRPKSSVM